MLSSRIFCVFFVILVSSLGPIHASGSEPTPEQLETEELIFGLHTFSLEQKVRLTGLLGNSVLRDEVKDPFAAPSNTPDHTGPCHVKTFWESLSDLGFSYDKGSIDPSVGYDGEQLHLHATCLLYTSPSPRDA